MGLGRRGAHLQGRGRGRQGGEQDLLPGGQGRRHRPPAALGHRDGKRSETFFFTCGKANRCLEVVFFLVAGGGGDLSSQAWL